MLNLDVLKGLSYQKGCYPGQEVIARLHYRGEVKKRLSLITVRTTVVTIGEQLTSEQSRWQSRQQSLILQRILMGRLMHWQ